jgi:hypothetical protein
MRRTKYIFPSIQTEENRGKQRKFIKFERRVLAGLTFLMVAIVSINNLTA